MPRRPVPQRRVIFIGVEGPSERRFVQWRDAVAAARRYEFRIVLLTPNLEGLLLRLHPGREQTKPVANLAERELRKLWPDYRKPPEARELRRRFLLADLRRAAEHDDHLGTLLEVLGL